jgi:glycosyltransferase involved in cell wall biosynthesis
MRIGVLVAAFPMTSETFVAGEVLRLRRRGVDVRVIVLGSPAGTDAAQRRALEDAGVEVEYLRGAGLAGLARRAAKGLARNPLACMKTVRLNHGWPTSGASRSARLARVWAVLELVERWQLELLHCHWTAATDIAYMLERTAGVPFSISAHAVDIYDEARRGEAARAALVEKVRASAFVTTCTANNEQFLGQLVPAAAPRVHLAYHGIDLSLFDGTSSPDDGGPPLILSVGRLVEKKGFVRLIAVVSRLAAGGTAARLVIVGDGPDRAALEALIAEQGLGDVVELAGAQPHPEVREWLRKASVFALCPDVEQGHYGIPNVLFEAMAMRVPPVTFLLPGIEELVDSGRNGIIAADDDELLEGLRRLIADPAERRRMGDAGRETVVHGFDAEATIEVVMDSLRAFERSGA